MLESLCYDTGVVIPIQTISFYNIPVNLTEPTHDVVIPIQTISFYNGAGE